MEKNCKLDIYELKEITIIIIIIILFIFLSNLNYTILLLFIKIYCELSISFVLINK